MAGTSVTMATALLTMIGTGVAYGQSAEDAPASSSAPAGPRIIEEIVVNAQKRAESLQDVPISIVAFPGDELVDLGITDTQQLQMVTPGLIYGSNAGYAQAYIRGIGSEATLPTADPSIATYVDGVYYPMIQSTIQSFGNVDRIEVLRGPQGTLWGRNATGGAINVVTRDPGPEREVSIDAEYGSFDHGRFSLYASQPLLDFLAISVAGFFDRTDAYYEQLNPTGPEILDTKNWGVRPKLAFYPGKLFDFVDLRMVLSGYILDHQGADTNVINQFDPTPLAELLGASPTPEPFKANSNLPQKNFTTIHGINLVTTLGFDWLDVVSISAYQDVDNVGFVDYDGSPGNAAGFGAQPGVSESTSQEIQLKSNGSGPLGWLEWVAGAYYLTGEGGFVPLNFILGSPIPAVAGTEGIYGVMSDILAQVEPGVPLPPFTLPPTQQFPFPIPVPALTTPSLPGQHTYVGVPLLSIVETDALAGFGQASYSVFDWLKLTVGLRYSSEKRALTRNELYAPYFITDPARADERRGLPQGNKPLAVRAARSKTFNNLSTRFGIDLPFEDLWFVNEGMFFVSRSTGFKSGTFNPVQIVEEPPPVEEETVTSYEFGFKASLFDRGVRLNASAFHYDYDDLQLQTIALTSGGAVRLENAGNATVQGVDAEVVWLPWFLDGLDLSVGASFLDSEYLVCNCSGFDPNTGIAFRGDFSGNELVRAPDLTLSTQVSYRLEVWRGPVEIAATIYHNSGFWFDAQNTFFQEAYELYDARLKYTYEPWGVGISGYGKNLADKEYLINGNVNDFGRFGTFGAPREIGVRAQWRF